MSTQVNMESIISNELEKLELKRFQMKEDNEKYLANHPELNGLLDEYVSAVIANKPNNLIKFSEEYFRSKVEGTKLGPAPLVFAGPSGVGKGTIISALMKRYPSVFGFSVSHTTRAPRAGEENGVHYHFVQKDEMELGISKGEFIEHAAVHTNFYGTSFKAVEKVRSENKICILDIDIQGVMGVKKSSLDCKYAFIAPPSIEELEARLRGRGTETEDKIQVRMKNAIDELQFGQTPGNFDAIIYNNDLEVAIQEVLQLLQVWYPNVDFIQ